MTRTYAIRTPALDLTGRVFGKLTVLAHAGRTEKGKGKRNACRLWRCRCECGREVLLPTASLTRTARRPRTDCLECSPRRRRGPTAADKLRPPSVSAFVAATLRVVEGLTLREVARRMGGSHQRVADYLASCRAWLARRAAAEG